jgi:hypothetical protein
MALKAILGGFAERARNGRETRARRLADGGRYREAIERLAPLPADDLSAELLRDLVKWRRAAFEAGRPAAVWPRRLPDPFPGFQGVPEIACADLTTDIMGGAILHHGGLIVRGLIDPAETARLVAIVEQARSVAASQAETGPSAPVSRWYCPLPLDSDDMLASGRSFIRSHGQVLTADSPAALAELIRFLKGHGVTRMIEDYLGEPTYLSLGKSTMRHATPSSVSTWWHQDGSFLGEATRTVNCWLTLSDCGEHAPGLDIYPRRVNGLVEAGTRGAEDWWIVANGVVEDMTREMQTPLVRPVFTAGDAMLFDQLLLHRTHIWPGMTEERLAIESWFFAGSTFPMAQIPIAL